MRNALFELKGGERRMKRKVITGLVLALFVTILFSMVFNVAPADDKQIPFPGMMLVYTEQEIGVQPWSGWQLAEVKVFRTVTFLPSLEPGCIWMRDSLFPESIEGVPDFSEAEIDISTRKIVQPPDRNYYSQFLIPTNIRVNDVINVGVPELSGTSPGLPLTVVGTQMISVMGKEVYAWVLEEHTPQYIYTMFYCKKTGILLSGQGAWFNEDGTPTYSWTTLLTDTNAQIG